MTVTDTVILSRPHRLGINIGQNAYYGDQEIVAEPFAHGGFAKGRQVRIIQVKASTANKVTDAAFDATRPYTTCPESFAGGVYCIATGVRAGETGTIAQHNTDKGVFVLQHSGSPLAEGDVIWLRGPWVARASPEPKQGSQPLGLGRFHIEAAHGAEVDLVDAEANPRDQYLRVRLPGESSAGGVSHGVAAAPNTDYRVRVRARCDASAANLNVTLRNLGIPGGQPGNILRMSGKDGSTIGPDWRDFVFDARTLGDPRICDLFSVVIVTATAPQAQRQVTVLFDSVHFENLSIRSDCRFGSRLLHRIREARCGVLRFYGIAGLASLVDDITARSAAESTWTFSSSPTGYAFQTTGAVVDNWMQLCLETGAVPWIVVGNTNTPGDWRRLISYLAAPADFDEDSRRRAAHGFAAPWTDRFGKIYLEIGNEWWNRVFWPFIVPSAEKYGELCNTIIRAVRSHPHFRDDKIDIVAGGWAINAHRWNNILDRTAQGHEVISIAPYLIHELDDISTIEAKYGALFADVDSYARSAGPSCLNALSQTGKGTRVAVYELNTHLTSPKVPPAVSSEMCTSVAAGVAVLDQAMSCMSRLRADPINYFTYLQRAFGRGDQERLGLWGNLVRTRSGEHRPRPVWLGLQLANRFLIEGDMVAVELRDIPTWSQPANGRVIAMSDVPYLHAYAFLCEESGKRRVNLLLINRHRTDPLPVRVKLPFVPAKTARVIVLTGRDLSDNNEEWERVKLTEAAVHNFSEGETIPLPPFSAVVIQIAEASTKKTD